jgi:hypothetical protein
MNDHHRLRRRQFAQLKTEHVKAAERRDHQEHRPKQQHRRLAAGEHGIESDQ